MLKLCPETDGRVAFKGVLVSFKRMPWRDRLEYSVSQRRKPEHKAKALPQFVRRLRGNWRGKAALIRRDGEFFVVSTVRLPVVYDALGGQFETMVFPAHKDGTVTNHTDLFCDRHRTEEEAIEAFWRVVHKWNG